MSATSRSFVGESWSGLPPYATVPDPMRGEPTLPAIAGSAVLADADRDEKRIIARSPAMVRLLDELHVAAASSAPVLITGEEGSGKQLVARELHRRSRRAAGPFIAVDCAAVPGALLEAELFGHEGGTVTGSPGRRIGRLLAAAGGTIFLDGIDELPPGAQAKLLRLIEEGVVEPLGATQPVRIDVRVVCTTHGDPRARIAEELFRLDLFSRIGGLELRVPALREREGDLGMLAHHFLQTFWELPTPPAITAAARQALESHPFPGNVRELKDAMRHAAVMARGSAVDVEHLPAEIGPPASDAQPERAIPRLADALHAYERTVLLKALQQCQGRRTRTARLLGISRKTLWQKMRLHGIGAAEIV